jgi:hypothetical protein
VRRAAVIVALAACALATGCSGDDDDDEPAADQASTPPATEAAKPPANESPAPLAPARCPASIANCRTASGRIVYVERVDPDGDGDAHFVLISREGITGPGLSVIDVARSLRPHPLPGPGDRVSAAGPVYKGSYGQRQIEAVELHVAR